MLIIPLNPFKSQKLAVTLANQECSLNIYQKMSGLYCDVFVDDAIIVGGVLCHNLDRIIKDNYFGFLGDLVFLDTQISQAPNSPEGSDPYYTELGTRFKLVYLTVDEINRIAISVLPLSSFEAVIAPVIPPTPPTPSEDVFDMLANIAALRSYSVNTSLVGKGIYVGGYNTIGDGGEGFFYINNVNPGPENGGMIIWSSTPNFYYTRFMEAQPLSVRWFGAVGDGIADDAPAIQAAVDWATAHGHMNVYVPAGIYRLRTGIVIKEGVKIIGYGGQGSDYNHGVVYMFEPTIANQIAFLWNGNGAFVGGTGGGMENGLIMMNNSQTGCTAIKTIATDDNHRPGEEIFRNLLSYGVGSNRFDEGLVIDGTAANTPGGKGVRSTLIEKVRMASCNINNYRFSQAVHVFATYMECDLGTSAVSNFLIEGDWDDIFLSGCEINGTMVVNGATIPANEGNLTLFGRVAILDINAPYVQGAANIQSESITCAAKNFHIVSNLPDEFKLNYLTNSGAATGDGSVGTFSWHSASYDKNSCVDATKSYYQCKQAGVKRFFASVVYGGLSSAHVQQNTAIIHQTSGGVRLGTYELASNPYAMSTSGVVGIPLSAEFECAETDQVMVAYSVSGGAMTVIAIGAAVATGGGSYFTGSSVA